MKNSRLSFLIIRSHIRIFNILSVIINQNLVIYSQGQKAYKNTTISWFKRICISILLLNFFTIAGAQTDLIGTRWVYDEIIRGEKNYLVYEIERDTIVDGERNYIMSFGRQGFLFPDAPLTFKHHQNYLLKTIGDSVFVKKSATEFSFLFDLSPQIDDVWIVESIRNLPCDSLQARFDTLHIIDSISQQIGNNTLVKYSLTSSSGNYNYADFISGVGPLVDFFPSPAYECYLDAFSGVGLGEGLVCFDNNSKNIQFKTDNYNICSFLLPAETINNNKEVFFFPNPVTTSIQINFSAKKIEIYNFQNLVRVIEKPKTSLIDLQFLAPGFYIIRILDENNNFKINKLIKL